jgi:hypothetical protein
VRLERLSSNIFSPHHYKKPHSERAGFERNLRIEEHPDAVWIFFFCEIGVPPSDAKFYVFRLHSTELFPFDLLQSME